jgi:predicted PurR-regulated permease PerM
MNKPIEISTGIIIKTLAIIIALLFLYFVRDIITLFFIAVLLSAVIAPMVDRMQIKKIPRWVGILLIYLFLFLLVAVAVYFLIPPLEKQFTDFAKNSPEYLGKMAAPLEKLDIFFERQNISFDADQVIDNFSQELYGYSNNIFSTTVGIFTGFLSVIIVLTLTFYMAVEEDGMKKFIVLIVPVRHKEYAASLVMRIKAKITRWMHGQLLIMLSIFALDFVGLSLAGVPYALFLAIFAGIMELIPYAGPVISAVPGVFLGFMISPFTGFMALLVYLVAQQFESHVIIPQVMKKAVGLNPIVIILALLIGAKLAGVTGAILSVPIATAVGLFLSDMFNRKEGI